MITQAERAQRLVLVAEDLSRQAKLVKKFRALRTRADQLEKLRVDVVELGDAHSRLADLQLAPRTDHDTTARLRGLTDDLRARMEREPMSIIEDDRIKERYLDPLRAHCKSWRNELLSAWGEWINCHVAFQPDALLTVLNNIPSRRERITEIRNLQRELREISSSLPSAESAARVGSLSAALTKVRSTVGQGELPPQVEAFLVKLGEKKARLSDIDTAVRQWLEAEGLLDDFAVVAG